MAIAKICSVSGNSSSVLAYAIEQKDKKLPQEQKAEIVQVNNLFGDIQDMSNQMAMFQEDRPNCKNNVLHLALSFDPAERLNAMQAEKAINTLLEEVGITKADHQYVVVEHKDAAHQHFHIVASRVGMDGSLLSDSLLKVRLNVICDKIEKEQGLLPTPGRQWQYDPSSEKGYKFVKVEKVKALKNGKNPKINDVKAEIRKELEALLSKKEIRTPEQLLQALKVKGIEVKYSENKNGIAGVSFRSNDIAVKGSAVGYKWSDIGKKLTENAKAGQVIKKPLKIDKRPVLSREIKNKMLLFIRQNPEKFSNNEQLADQAIRIYMRELKPDQNSWQTWEAHRDHEKKRRVLNRYASIALSYNERNAKLQTEILKGKPVPSERDLQQMHFVKQYNQAVSLSIAEFRAEINKGNLHCNVDLIFLKNGFTQQGEQYFYKVGKQSITINKNKLIEAQTEILRSYDNYLQRMQAYNKLMQEKPRQPTTWERLTGKSKEIEVSNRKLDQMQTQTGKPYFNLDIRLNERSFLRTTNFIVQMAEWEKKEKNKAISINKPEENEIRTKRRGMSR
ncbi:hypothetical protein AAKU52_003427 [Pedobacter sp. CG_S7]|uniref:relaxase/mobilization nuclease domain-containing protein n=1 Tax=Pedobacter sp. CG_S7 TaxID=3143930 RepID=UPI0033933787